MDMMRPSLRGIFSATQIKPTVRRAYLHFRRAASRTDRLIKLFVDSAEIAIGKEIVVGADIVPFIV